jgi:transposase
MPPVEEVYAECLCLRDKVAAQAEELARLTAQIEWFKKQMFGGGKSEKQDAAQLRLGLDEKTAPAEPATQQITYERKSPKPAVKQVAAEHFANLPIEETVTIEPSEVQADPEQYERIGQEETFEVDIHPPRLFKRLIVRPKYRHKRDRDLPPVVAAAPKRPVEGGYASAGLLSYIVMSKYVDHLPLYRQETMSESWGAKLSRKTMCDWVDVASQWLEPIYKEMRRGLLEGGYLQADETPIHCNDPDLRDGKTTQGWLWVISRPGADVVFDWRLTRRHGELTSLVDGFSGILQSDGYQAYASHAASHKDVVWVGCWAHARRKFNEALSEAPRQASLVLHLIGYLYEKEAQWDAEGIAPEQRAQLRERDFARRLALLKKLATALRRRARPRSLLGEACSYLLSQWSPLVTHCAFGQTRLDNNLVENAIRPSAIGKKNWLFIGDPDAGQRSAILYSIVVSCQRHGKDPHAYLRDVLSRLPKMSNKDDLSALTPANWQPEKNEAKTKSGEE